MEKCKKFIKAVIMVCTSIFFVGAVCFLGSRISGAVRNINGRQEGRGWSAAEKIFPETDASALFDMICKELEEEFRGRELHMDTILMAPEEYEVWEVMEGLIQIDKSALPVSKRLLYDRLMYCLEMYQWKRQLPDYDMLFSEVTGAMNTIPEIFYTCRLDSKEEIEQYLQLLSQTPFLWERFLDRLRNQQKIGVTWQKELVEKQLEICRRLIGGESIFLTDFREKIEAADFLKDREKEWYIRQNQYIVTTEICPVMKEIEVQLMAAEVQGKQQGLCEYVMGKQYFDYILERNTGTGMNAEEMFEYLDVKRIGLKEKIRLRSHDAAGGIGDCAFDEIVEFLYENTKRQYPEIVEVDWDVYLIPEYLDGKLYSAFFTKGILKEDNYVYIDCGMDDRSYLENYQTLAHEAFPGHMYWYNYGNKEWPELEQQIKCLGYGEGWAVAAEYAAGEWLQEDRENYYYIADKKLFDQLFLCQADIGIHAYGWKEEEIFDFMKEVYGMADMSIVNEIYLTLAVNAGMYEPYVVGYYQFVELLQYCKDELGMGEEEFLRFYLEAGQSPFSLMREYTDIW